MCRRVLKSTIVLVSAYLGCGLASVQAADLIWEVENPLRFYKSATAFDMHERAFNAIRGDQNGPVPNNIVSRIERRLNDPDCGDPSKPDVCIKTAKARFDKTRMGWAAQTLDQTCYDRNARPRRYHTVCERQYSWGKAKEDYVLPDAHTVVLRLAPERLAEVGEGACVWSWQSRSGAGQAATRTQACKARLVIPRVPYSLNRAASGVSVKVQLPDGRELADPTVVVEDLLIVAVGDSFASGESNPDRPVIFSANREMVYDPSMTPEERANVASLGNQRKKAPASTYSVASTDEGYDPKSLPRRLLEDEEAGRVLAPMSREYLAAFNKREASWLSRDCHRSQYGYPFRASMELALEDRHRSVTLVNLACSGSEVTEGLFLDKPVREGFDEPNGKTSPAQFDQLSDLLCRGGASAKSQRAAYTLPMFKVGSTSIEMRQVTKSWCPPDARKRAIDLVFMSIGGNDVGFSALAMYAMTDSAGDIAPIVGWIGREIRFGPDVARAYLGVLDERLKAVKDALRDGFGVEPSKVLHNSYEPLQYDEKGELCGSQPTLGMDVHPKLRYNRERLQEASVFLGELLGRLECISGTGKRSCPAGLATGQGTGFRLVTEHIPEFSRRGMCARDPKRPEFDGIAMAMPRKSRRTDEFRPYSPAMTAPYAHRWRLFHTPNDAFLAANVHREGVPLYDLLQPAYAALYSGAFHPTAEAHAIVADHVVRHARALLDKRSVVEAKGQ